MPVPPIKDGIVDTRCHHHYESGRNILEAVDEALNENCREDQDTKPDKLTVRWDPVAFKEIHDDNHR